MAEPHAAAVDVQDMLCAQALAVVAQAMGRLGPGGLLSIRYNAEDVRRDLVAWARDRGHAVEEPTEGFLRMTARPAASP